MGFPRIEEGVGTIDGANTTFFTPTAPYGAGSVRYYLNGQLAEEVCVTEVDPASGEIEVDTAPRVGDVVQFFYDDESSAAPPEAGRTIRPIVGRIEAVYELHGSLRMFA